MKKQIMSLLHALFIILPLVSCSGSNEPQNDGFDAGGTTASAVTGSETETEPQRPAVTDDLPELKFEKDFNMISPTLGHCTSIRVR